MHTVELIIILCTEFLRLLQLLQLEKLMQL